MQEAEGVVGPQGGAGCLHQRNPRAGVEEPALTGPELVRHMRVPHRHDAVVRVAQHLLAEAVQRVRLRKLEPCKDACKKVGEDKPAQAAEQVQSGPADAPPQRCAFRSGGRQRVEDVGKLRGQHDDSDHDRNGDCQRNRKEALEHVAVVAFRNDAQHERDVGEQDAYRQRKPFADQEGKKVFPWTDVVQIGIDRLKAVHQIAVEEGAERNIQFFLCVAERRLPQHKRIAVVAVAVFDIQIGVDHDGVVDEVQVRQHPFLQRLPDIFPARAGNHLRHLQAQGVADRRPVPFQVVIPFYQNGFVVVVRPAGKSRKKLVVPFHCAPQPPGRLEVVRLEPEIPFFLRDGAAKFRDGFFDADLRESFLPQKKIFLAFGKLYNPQEVDHIAVDHQQPVPGRNLAAQIIDKTAERPVAEKILRPFVASVGSGSGSHMQIADQHHLPAFAVVPDHMRQLSAADGIFPCKARPLAVQKK